jgi:membrane protein implicated in regulation of membrane protease activity
VKDSLRWPAFGLIGLGLLAFALSLVGFAVGMSDRALLGLSVAVCAVLAAIGWLFVERRAVRKGNPRRPPERPEDTTALP